MQHKFYMVGHQYMYTCTRPNDNETSILIPTLLTRVKSDVQLVIYNALVNLVACVGLEEDPWKIQINQIPIVKFQKIDNEHSPPPGGKFFSGFTHGLFLELIQYLPYPYQPGVPRVRSSNLVRRVTMEIVF